MLIAHISDFHVVPGPALCYGFSDTRLRLAQTVAAIERLRPRPDLVLATGDLVDEPGVEAYRELRRITDRLSVPLVVLPGNHDDRALLAAAFPGHDYLPAGGAKAHFVLDFPELRLVAFDAVVAGKEYAQLDADGLAWLDRTLAVVDHRPVMIAMHHPPIATGLAFMDAFQPPLPAFAEVVRAHPAVKLIACGHVHRMIDGAIGGARIAAAASSAHQFAFSTDPDAPPRMSMEPAALRLHLWQAGEVSSFVVPVDGNHPVVDFEGMDEARWKAIREALRAGIDRHAAQAEHP